MNCIAAGWDVSVKCFSQEQNSDMFNVGIKTEILQLLFNTLSE